MRREKEERGEGRKEREDEEGEGGEGRKEREDEEGKGGEERRVERGGKMRK